MKFKTNIVLIGIVLLAPCLTGCRILHMLPHNYTCPPPTAPKYFISDRAAAPQESMSQPLEVVEPQPYVTTEEFAKLKEELTAVSAENKSLQEQLVLLDQNTEKLSSESKSMAEQFAELNSSMTGVKDSVEKQKKDLEVVASRLALERQSHERVLASVERQLSDLVEEYEDEVQ